MVGHSYSPPMAKPKEKENAWGNFHKADAFDASSVTTLFSSSLPVLPHGKRKFCQCQLSDILHLIFTILCNVN